MCRKARPTLPALVTREYRQIMSRWLETLLVIAAILIIAMVLTTRGANSSDDDDE
jgi:hypothetical protein